MNSSFAFQPHNPFSTDFISPSQVVYRFGAGANATSEQSVDAYLESLLSRLRECRRGLVVGPHGTGKSTLLHTFLPKLQRGYPKVAFHQLANDPNQSLRQRLQHRMRVGRRIADELSHLPSGGLLVVDGWEQLGRLRRWKTVRTAGARKITLLVTAHKPISGWSVLHETGASPKITRALAKDLTKDSPYHIQKIVDDRLKSKRVHPETNIRELWFELYDLVEDENHKPREAGASAFMPKR